MPVLQIGIHLPPSPQRIPTAEVLRDKAYIQKNDNPMWKPDEMRDRRNEKEEARRETGKASGTGISRDRI